MVEGFAADGAAGGHEREAADAAFGVVARNAAGFVGGDDVVGIAAGMEMGGLGAPFAVFGAFAGAGVDD